MSHHIARVAHQPHATYAKWCHPHYPVEYPHYPLEHTHYPVEYPQYPVEYPHYPVEYPGTVVPTGA